MCVRESVWFGLVFQAITGYLKLSLKSNLIINQNQKSESKVKSQNQKLSKTIEARRNLRYSYKTSVHLELSQWSMMELFCENS